MLTMLQTLVMQHMVWILSKWFYDTSTGAATGAARCGSFVAGKDGNRYPLSVCPQVKNPLGTDSGTSLYPRVWVQVAFDIHGYLQNG
jgi:hypothetical protein